ncbi:pirin family protein [Saliphagus infecundisoli]|uniref:Pirin family protein n=1 Tax=Saliphagus infecundisoli TaxID=1849069 RepID=A0ABD5QFT6_9EURY|nr:pirin family protein [Saliphagus infecundisoli]
MTQSTTEIHTAPRTDVIRDQGGFRTAFDFPGRNLPGHDDHGYGPLATVVESVLDPGTLIGMHPHRNEEIISWVPAGVMRHDDREGNRLVTDPESLLVMNAGSGFWHEERTTDDDPPLRMLQIFVRPRELDLEPGIQHGPVPDPTSGEWRHLFGPEGSGAPFSVRNDVDLYDVRLERGRETELPAMAGRDAYVYVFEGEIGVGDARLGQGESALLVGGGSEPIRATEESVVVAFLIDPDAPVTRQGTIGR